MYQFCVGLGLREPRVLRRDHPLGVPQHQQDLLHIWRSSRTVMEVTYIMSTQYHSLIMTTPLGDFHLPDPHSAGHHQTVGPLGLPGTSH